MNCEDLSRKALELGLSKFDIEAIKQPFNGWIVKETNTDKEEEIKELRRWISNNEYSGTKKKPIRQRKILTKKI